MSLRQVITALFSGSVCSTHVVAQLTDCKTQLPPPDLGTNGTAGGCLLPSVLSGLASLWAVPLGAASLTADKVIATFLLLA